MFRILATAILLIAIPLASADEVCVGDVNAFACAVANSDPRFSWYGVFAYEASTDTFASAGYGEGSGFFADTAAIDAVSHSSVTGQWVVVVVAMNDYGRNGDYDDVSIYAGTWNDAGPGVGYGYYTPLP